MGKHLVDLDEAALQAARATLGTATIRDTVNQALRIVAHDSAPRLEAALDQLAGINFDDRSQAWR
jgi:Arc/MetJ family transcription regulator